MMSSSSVSGPTTLTNYSSAPSFPNSLMPGGAPKQVPNAFNEFGVVPETPNSTMTAQGDPFMNQGGQGKVFTVVRTFEPSMDDELVIYVSFYFFTG
jgi:hypothetical protein